MHDRIRAAKVFPPGLAEREPVGAALVVSKDAGHGVNHLGRSNVAERRVAEDEPILQKGHANVRVTTCEEDVLKKIK